MEETGDRELPPRLDRVSPHPSGDWQLATGNSLPEGLKLES
jgi:hypothetical protein